jgi:hypothetical protein
MAGRLQTSARMFALRCFVWGSVIGIAFAVARRPRYEVRVVTMHHPPRALSFTHGPSAGWPHHGFHGFAATGSDSAATIVDVAAGVTPTLLPSLVKLAPGEHVVAVDDRHVANDLEAGALIANSAPHGYVELDASTGRRIVLILH